MNRPVESDAQDGQDPGDLVEMRPVEVDASGLFVSVPGRPPSNSLLTLILAATNDGVMDWNLVTGAIHYSERWKALLGYEDRDLPSSESLWRDLSHPDDLPEVEALLRDHTESLWPFEHTWRMRHKNGEWRWLLGRAGTLHDRQGTPQRCVCVFTDVTNQVSAQRRLAELKRRNDLLLSSTGEGFLGIDAAARVTFANPAALQLIGLSGLDVTGWLLGEAIPHGCPNDRPCLPTTCPILKPFLGGAANKVTNATFGRKDGSSFAVDYLSTPAHEGDSVVKVVMTFRDVTEQRRLEAQNLQGQKLEALGQLAAGIAHEINTPLQYVGDNVFFLDTAFSDLLTLVAEYRQVVTALKQGGEAGDLLARLEAVEIATDVEYLKECIPKAIVTTQDGIGRVRTIVSAMKAFSHPGGAEKSAEDLNHAIECTTTIAASTWRHTATLEMRLDPALPKVSCYLGDINQVVLNLLVNASHAIEDAQAGHPAATLGVITVETGVKDGFVEVRISDTGCGIPETIQHRLFEPFFTTKEVGRGTGQGLTLARSMIVDRHGGYLKFTTEVGKGTTFIIGLPLPTGP